MTMKSLYESLLQISEGKLDVFREATDAFVQAANEINIGQHTDAPSNTAETE